MAATKRNTVGRVPAEPLVKALRSYLKLDDERFRMTGRMVADDMILSPTAVLADELGVSRDMVRKICYGQRNTIDERTADMLACAIGRPDVYDVDLDEWH